MVVCSDEFPFGALGLFLGAKMLVLEGKIHNLFLGTEMSMVLIVHGL